jgi:BirA family biotin operon repressor/biotin-[acetyl-CoA-carboxylase] ligase
MHPTFPVIEGLEPDKILFQLQSTHRNKLSRLDLFNTITSTNSYLLERAGAEDISGWFCFAETQTAGRGRRGRKWFSPRSANIYCSVLWRFPAAQNLSALSLALAVILGEVLHKYGVPEGTGFKWPNDIVFSERKLAGILLESLPEKNAFISVVIGLGINLQLPASPDAEKNWIDLAEITNAPLRRNAFAGLLVDELLGQLGVFEQEGFAAFIDRWRRRDILYRRNVIVQMSNQSIAGIAHGIDENGALKVETTAGEWLKLQGGEVSVRLE